jgi:uncharacterized membrane protein
MGVILLRLLHVGLGVFWAGTIFFMVSYLDPAIRATLPASAVIPQQLMQRKFMVVLPITALVTILSGIALYWRDSGGMVPGWTSTPLGMTLSIGGASAIIGFLIGVFILRAAQMRMMALGPQMQKAEGPEKERLMNEIVALRGRATAALRAVATLLGITVVCMAVARYV